MDDSQILELYRARSENAIAETANKYGKYCHYIARNILHDNEESEECVNDTYLKAWENIPPQAPKQLGTFLGKITRNLALNKHKHDTTQKRGAGQVSMALDELQECLPDGSDVEQVVDELVLTEILNQFLVSLPTETRKVFMRRYWYLCSIKEIAADFNISESKVKMLLLRARNELKKTLEKEGFQL